MIPSRHDRGYAMGKGKPDIIGIDHRAIFDANPDMSYIVDADGRILDANRTAVERYGYSLDELKQMTVSDLVPADLKPSLAARLKQPLDAGKTFEWRHRRKDGTELPVEIYLQTIVLHGEPVILCRAHDIGRRRKMETELQNQQRLLERIVESEPGTVYINDLVNKQVVYINREWSSAYGYTPEETQAMVAGLLDLIHPDDLPAIAASNKAWKTAADGEMRTIEYRVRDKQGNWHWLISRETPFSRDNSGSVSQILGIARDITERKHSEQLIGGQNRVLGMIAAGIALPETLDALVRMIEDLSPGMLGSILLLDKDGVHVRHGAAPSLPAEFVAAVDGQPIGPVAGSCGTAAYRREAVYVEDIATDPLWENYKEAALPHGLRACWSTPILDTQGQVLGTFAMYFRQPGLPNAEHRRLVDAATQIAAIAISRQREEQALRESEHKFEILFGQASLPAALTLFPGQVYVDVNDAWLELFGYTRDEVLGRNPAELGVSRADGPRDSAAGALAHGFPLRNFEQTLYDRSGNPITVLTNINLVKIGGQDYAITSLQDITERKRAETALLEKERDLEQAQTIGRFGSWTHDLAGHLTWSAEVYRIFGVSPAYPTDAESFSRLIHPDDLAAVQAWNDACVSGLKPGPIEWRCIRPDGDVRYILGRGALITDAGGMNIHMAGTVQDITERKLAEMGLKKSEERLLQAQEVANMGFLEWNLKTNQIKCSDQVCRMYGLDPAVSYRTPDFIGQLVHPDDLDYMRENLDLAVRRVKDYDIDQRIIRPDGSILWVHAQAELIRDADGNGEVLLGTVVDITAHKRAEAALLESEEKLRLFIRYTPSAVAMFDRDMRYIAYSRRWLTDYNLGEQELAGRSYYDVFPELPEHWRRIHQRCMEGLIAKNDGEKLLRSDGSEDWVRWESHPWRTGEGNIGGIIIFSEVITERKLAEAKIHRVSQLYAALSQCNQAIVRCSSEAELLAQICRDVVDYGGMKMAWIGMVDKDINMVSPVASFGTGTEYLEGIEISLDPDSPTAGGPTFMAISENRPYWIQDFQHDPATSHWHERAARFDWGASASLPLHRKGVAIGVFGVYSGEVNAFDEQIKDLLVEMAIDISFALDNLDTRIAHDQALEKISLQNMILQTQQETSLDAILVVDENGIITSCNQKFIDLWQLQPHLVSMCDDAPVIRANAAQTEDPEAYIARTEYLYEHREEKSREEILLKDGRVIDRYSAPVIGAHGEYYGRVWYFRDITERKHAEERISYLANYDALTGLPNRAQLDRQFSYALGLAKRNNEHLAVMFVDIDRFKDINDTLGHSIGDALLVKIARRIQDALRESDTASRLGGDEFILMLSGGEVGGFAQVAQKLLQAIAEPYRIEQYDLVVTASIGITLYPDDGADLESLSRNADTAMYRAKKEGRNRYRFFTAEMQASATRNMQLLNALRTALERGQFRVHYQPQVSIPDGRIIGMEALLRWRHPELGNISPAEFIPVAEDSGLILPIGEWVMRTAVRQLKRWMDSGHPPMVIAVNLSAVQFRHTSLPDMVTGILNESQLAPGYLELELTEGVAMYDPLGAIATMNHLHELGIRMSIDDFGTGYSSLNYLKRFKVYKLKIDQSFVRDISTDQEDKAIVAAIISMSRDLGLQTIAEGVESAEQLGYLRDQGCDEAQGYYFSKPLDTDQMEQILKRGKGLPVNP
ncbi:MAG: PAS domain S-box protein [Gallionella sp.]